MPFDVTDEELHAALDRVQAELTKLNAQSGSDKTPDHGLSHVCAEWTPDPETGCEICWEFAVQIGWAFRGVTPCATCHGSGQRPGAEGTIACCTECGGAGEIDPADN